MSLSRRLRFTDLVERKIVRNRVTLRNWINDPQIGFPPGQMTGPNTRTWGEDEVEVWVASRPVTNNTDETTAAASTETVES